MTERGFALPPSFIIDGPQESPVTVLLAHGAGAPMDSPAMNTLAKALAGAGFRVARFEFGYMAARRAGHRKPPPKADTLIPEFREAVRSLDWSGRLILGGKSMGGRIASMIADDLHAAGTAAGLLCLGYPFHPPGKPGQLRTAHLANLATPALICQGTRDEFGTREEVATYTLSPRIELLWIEDGDHDLRPRKSVAGVGFEQTISETAAKVRAWSDRIAI